MLCGILGKPQEEVAQHRSRGFWRKVTLFEAENYFPFQELHLAWGLVETEHLSRGHK